MEDLLHGTGSFSGFKMPRVAYWEATIEGEEFKLPIYYTTTEKKFRIHPPGPLQRSPIDAPSKILEDTEEDLRNKMTEYVKKLVDLKETKTKVIAYKFKGKCTIWPEYDDRGKGVGKIVYSRTWDHPKRYGYGTPGDGTTLQVDYLLLWEYRSPLREAPYYKKEYPHAGEITEQQTSWPGGYRRMVWTLQAEKFFREFEEHLKHMIRKIAEFLGEDSEELSMKIDQAAGLLPFFTG